MRAAHHMLHMGRVQACPNPGAFTGAMVVLFRQIANIHAPRGIDLDQVCLVWATVVAWLICVLSSGCLDLLSFVNPVTSSDVNGDCLKVVLILSMMQVMKAVLQLAREYEVTIDSSYAALVVGVCVIVGFATSLDPGLNLMDAATPAFLMHNLTGRIIGQLYA